MITSLRESLERSRKRIRVVMSRGVGEVYLAMDRKSNDLVVMKRVKMDENDSRLETELSLLKKCQSRYTVRYYDVLRKDCYWWVVCLWSV